jgi:hypothetical protein
MDAGDDGSDASDGGDVRDASDAADTPPPTCRTNEALCTDGGYDGGPGVCERDAGICVECLDDSNCTREPTAPICQDHACRACKTDAECAGPKVCMMDGHCATSDEVVFVEAGSSACLPPEGGTTDTYCTLNEGVSHLDALMGRTTLIVRGPINGPLTINGVAGSILVVGTPTTAGVAQIGAGVGTTGISVSGAGVIIRDLTVFSGGSAASKGIVATGSTTSLKLINVQVNLGMGLGIQADTGAQLTMDHCTVTGNNRGGVMLDGAHFDITNTTISNNGPGTDGMGNVWGGIRVINPPSTDPIRFHLLTVQNNNPVGVSCAGNVTADGVLASGNSSVDVTDATCGFSSCGSAVTATCGAPQ